MIKKNHIPKIETRDKITSRKNGIMIPLWKDYDFRPAMNPRYVYFFTCASRAHKGPYLHKKRRGLLSLIEGKAIFVYKTGKKFVEIKLDASRSATMLDITMGTGYLIKNPYSKEAKFLNICDYPWKPNENETIIPDFSGHYPK